MLMIINTMNSWKRALTKRSMKWRRETTKFVCVCVARCCFDWCPNWLVSWSGSSSGVDDTIKRDETQSTQSNSRQAHDVKTRGENRAQTPRRVALRIDGFDNVLCNVRRTRWRRWRQDDDEADEPTADGGRAGGRKQPMRWRASEWARVRAKMGAKVCTSQISRLPTIATPRFDRFLLPFFLSIATAVRRVLNAEPRGRNNARANGYMRRRLENKHRHRTASDRRPTIEVHDAAPSTSCCTRVLMMTIVAQLAIADNKTASRRNQSRGYRS